LTQLQTGDGRQAAVVRPGSELSVTTPNICLHSAYRHAEDRPSRRRIVEQSTHVSVLPDDDDVDDDVDDDDRDNYGNCEVRQS